MILYTITCKTKLRGYIALCPHTNFLIEMMYVELEMQVVMCGFGAVMFNFF
jgi:hypothetical protein